MPHFTGQSARGTWNIRLNSFASMGQSISSEGIILTPQYWKQPYAMAYTHTSPEGTCWNVDFVSDVIVHVWTVNAWGQVFEEDVPKAKFMTDWKQSKRNADFPEVR